jgi:hypothetical protein
MASVTSTSSFAPKSSASTPEKNMISQIRGFPSRTHLALAKLEKSVKEEVRRGSDPLALALSIAFGVTCGLFPIPMTTTLLCGAVDMSVRFVMPGRPLSTVVLQGVNLVVGPLEVTDIILLYC